MPNWVYNTLSVSGSKEKIAEFKELAGRKAPTGFDSETGVLTYDNKEEVLSFWNFKEPKDKAVYFGASDYKPEGYDSWTMEERMAHSMKFSSNGWYDWNIREWGTKWDACDVDLNDDSETSLGYSFNTAWSIPEPVFLAMVQKFPTLDFEFWSEEEQGWGAEFTSSDGDEDGERSLIMTKEWDIPDSHQDYVDRDREDSCNCASDPDDDEYWYADCPRPEKEFEVVVRQVIRITAKSAESAWEIANGVLENFTTAEQPDGVRISEDSVAWVEEDGVRVYPTLTEVA
jgi:hypothetical protein